MTIDEWVLEVALRWPYRNNKSKDELQTITDDLTSFSSGRTINELSPILQEFKSLKPPKGFAMWWFWDRVQKKASGTLYWRECANKHKYEHKGTCCPLCGSTEYILWSGSVLPGDTIEIQESCAYCPWYKESLSDPVKGLYGSTCNEYGTEKRGNAQICKECKCMDCCKMSYLYNNNEYEYRRMVGPLLETKFKESGLEWAQKPDKGRR